jgi:hypothetical protein
MLSCYFAQVFLPFQAELSLVYLQLDWFLIESTTLIILTINAII